MFGRSTVDERLEVLAWLGWALGKVAHFAFVCSGDFDVNVFAQHIGSGFNLVKF